MAAVVDAVTWKKWHLLAPLARPERPIALTFSALTLLALFGAQATTLIRKITRKEVAS